jgi:hypothetical protein
MSNWLRRMVVAATLALAGLLALSGPAAAGWMWG